MVNPTIFNKGFLNNKTLKLNIKIDEDTDENE